MKKALQYLLVLLLALPFIANGQDKVIAKNASISFFSSTPLEDINAQSRNAASALNLKTGELIFRVRNTSFEFSRKLMQEHFNENYMESDKFPFAEFKGTVENVEKLANNGEYALKAKGILNIHGVSRTYYVPVKITVENNVIKATCSFDVKVADHNIKIPSVVGKNIAEIINIKVQANYTAP